jgi:hypothetical protein
MEARVQLCVGYITRNSTQGVSTTRRNAMNPYNEAAYKRKLREQGYTDEEIEEYTDNLASDWYDRKVDQEMEDKYDKGESK